MLHPDFNVVLGKNVKLKAIQLYLIFVALSCCKINLFYDSALLLWERLL